MPGTTAQKTDHDPVLGATPGAPLRRDWRPLTYGLVAGLAALLLGALGQALPVPALFVLVALFAAAAVAAFLWRRAPASFTSSAQAVSGKRADLPAVSPPPPAVLTTEGLAAQFGGLPRALLDELPDAILLLDEEDRLVIANRAARASFVGVAYERKYLPTVMRRAAVLEAIARVRQSGFGETTEFTDLVPVERFIQAFVAPLVVEPAHRPAILVVLRDLTALKAVEQMRADFVANASHELRTPLSSLVGFIETLRGHAKEDPVARERFLGIMQDQAARMRRLIDDLLSLSRIELNEHVPPSGTVDLKHVALDVIDAFQPIARESRIAIQLNTAPGLPLAVGDRDELVQVLQNLIDNALKYGRPDTELEVTLGQGAPAGAPELAGPSCYIAVKDRGEGIAREHLPRLTERFYRVDVKQSRERGGTGLGLAIVKHIVSRHRGRLYVKSDIGIGSVFTVILPAAPIAGTQASFVSTAPADGLSGSSAETSIQEAP